MSGSVVTPPPGRHTRQSHVPPQWSAAALSAVRVVRPAGGRVRGAPAGASAGLRRGFGWVAAVNAAVAVVVSLPVWPVRLLGATPVPAMSSLVADRHRRLAGLCRAGGVRMARPPARRPRPRGGHNIELRGGRRGHALGAGAAGRQRPQCVGRPTAAEGHRRSGRAGWGPIRRCARAVRHMRGECAPRQRGPRGQRGAGRADRRMPRSARSVGSALA